MTSKTYTHDNQLPNLPIPSLNDSIERYKQSVDPLLNDEERKNLAKRLDDFLNSSEATKLQSLLMERSEKEFREGRNWLEQWWLQFAYLMWPDPISLTSNFYVVFDEKAAPIGQPQLKQAAKFTILLHRYKKLLDAGEITPEQLSKNPLSMHHYQKIFTTTRIPGKDADTLLTCDPGDYIVVICRRQHWVLNLSYSDGTPLTCREIELQMNKISEWSQEKHPHHSVGSLTAGDRRAWASAYDELMQHNMNQHNFGIIQRAMFVIALDDHSPQSDDEVGYHCLGGDASNRFFDKVIVGIVFRNGRIGANGEHSPLDAPITGAAVHFVAANISSMMDDDSMSSDSTSHREVDPKRLNWYFSPEVKVKIEEADAAYQIRWKDLDLKFLRTKTFSQKWARKYKLSADAVVQVST
eukprot:TRINITY_DN1187_c0_g1_i1.p1 TRINITY_DN1187_c0_g1~~TRINITY_DN1187_c0_g1_i1.p1  ORF type:complete len:410 (-),score=103.27 TRINITY_DN1187_c0_g1_i1:648-1877(-)